MFSKKTWPAWQPWDSKTRDRFIATKLPLDAGCRKHRDVFPPLLLCAHALHTTFLETPFPSSLHPRITATPVHHAAGVLSSSFRFLISLAVVSRRSAFILDPAGCRRHGALPYPYRSVSSRGAQLREEAPPPEVSALLGSA